MLFLWRSNRCIRPCNSLLNCALMTRFSWEVKITDQKTKATLGITEQKINGVLIYWLNCYIDVDSTHPGGEKATKGHTVRMWKSHVNWVHTAVRQVRFYLLVSNNLVELILYERTYQLLATVLSCLIANKNWHHHVRTPNCDIITYLCQTNTSNKFKPTLRIL